MSAGTVLDTLLWAAAAGAYILVALHVAAAACILRLLYLAGRRAWDRITWQYTARRAADAVLPVVSAIEGIEALEDELAATWKRMQPYYTSARTEENR